MWKKGTVKLSIPVPTTWCECGYQKDWHPVTPENSLGRQCDEFRPRADFPWMHTGVPTFGAAQTPEPIAYLPHSCEEWEIGSKEDVEGMIADLQSILDRWPPQ